MTSPKSQTVFRYFICLSLLFMVTGCADPKYLAEKLYWQAEQISRRISGTGVSQLKDSDYQEIINAYRKVVDTCPREPVEALQHRPKPLAHVVRGRNPRGPGGSRPRRSA